MGASSYRCAVLTALIAAVSAGAAPAAAQPYPSRPITLVVPFPPGGSATIIARIIADKMSEGLGQQIVIDNRGGAGGSIAARQVAKSAPDGATLLLAFTGTLAVSPLIFANVGYDPRHDGGRAARRERDDEGDRPVRVVLRGCSDRRHRCAGKQHDGRPGVTQNP